MFYIVLLISTLYNVSHHLSYLREVTGDEIWIYHRLSPKEKGETVDYLLLRLEVVPYSGVQKTFWTLQLC